MAKVCLLPEEIAVLKKVRDSRIPSVFKTDYLDFLLAVENIGFITEGILAGKKIDYDLTEDYNALQAGVDLSKLDEDAKEYYNGLIAVYNIFKKYYS